MKFPHNKYLQFMFFWIALVLVMRLLAAVVLNGDSLEYQARRFLFNYLMVYLGGALGSDFPVVAWLAIAAAATFVVAVCFPSETSSTWGQIAFGILAILSLFVIWVEPWVTPSGLATQVAFLLLKIPMFFVDIGVTLAWTGAWNVVIWCFEKDFYKAAEKTETKIESTPTVQAISTSTESAKSTPTEN